MRYYELCIKGLYLDNLCYESEEIIEPLQEVMVNISRINKPCMAVVIKECEKPNFKTKNILEILPTKLTKMQFKLATFITYYYANKLSFVLKFFEGSVNYECEKLEFKKSPILSQKQEKALNFIKENNTSLLFADTGSGKTEIYISLIKQYLEKGQQILLLMPEISLTPQMQKRLSLYFDDNFCIWHSKITKKKKSEYLAKFTSGQSCLVAGARSALFLPFTNLGLIIIDEEHDNSYKSNQLPFFNARDLAIFIGQKLNIKVVLGSATPSLTTFYKQKNFRLKGTFFESKKEFLYDESNLAITPFLLNELKDCLKRKKQAIIFLPARANFRQIMCKTCGETIKCPFCSISLSLHKRDKVLKCHYCGFMKSIDSTCPSCRGIMLEGQKIGTAELCERLEKELSEFSPKIVKFDSDEITSVKKLDTILKDFNDEKIDFLVGTSMLAKGHDYHNVDLSVILGLDEHLFRSNFKASEECLALAMQVAGRAGRKGFARVILQTKHKDFFQKYIDDYDSFLKDELENRKDLYPPFTRLLRIIIEDKDKNQGFKLCEKLGLEFKQMKSLQLVGYGACGIELMQDKFRFYVLLRSNKYTSLIKAQIYALGFNNVKTDMDPIDFY
ncbi:primosomal protein N' [Campylobacter sp. LR264d]|uniref:primosomal protein N' n=1 Tax=Campylobacter sp. LR264d TaxID=2593544 RepID=UPI00123AC78E|nr:primosomal protein N' [Campylobacter sp. LR264d]KAA6230352.1 primosomal protein N' [Campylobacter sp. LR264d]